MLHSIISDVLFNSSIFKVLFIVNLLCMLFNLSDIQHTSLSRGKKLSDDLEQFTLAVKHCVENSDKLPENYQIILTGFLVKELAKIKEKKISHLRKRDVFFLEKCLRGTHEEDINKAMNILDKLISS